MKRVGGAELRHHLRPSAGTAGRGAVISGWLDSPGVLLEGHFRHPGGLHAGHLFRPNVLAAADAKGMIRLAEAFLETAGLRTPRRIVVAPEGSSRGLFFADALARVLGLALVDGIPAGDDWLASDLLLPGDLAPPGARPSPGVRVALLVLEPAKVAAKLLATGERGAWLLEAGWPLAPEAECPSCAVGIPAVSAGELG